MLSKCRSASHPQLFESLAAVSNIASASGCPTTSEAVCRLDWEKCEDCADGDSPRFPTCCLPLHMVSLFGAYTTSNGFFQRLLALACQHPNLGTQVKSSCFFTRCLSRMWLCTLSVNTNIPNLYPISIGKSITTPVAIHQLRLNGVSLSQHFEPVYCVPVSPGNKHINSTNAKGRC